MARLIVSETRGLSVLHLFGGHAEFGIRLDADPGTHPHVVGNAFFPPFRCESFDVVVADPPYEVQTSLWVMIDAPDYAHPLQEARS